MRILKPPTLRPEEEHEILNLLINKVRKREPVQRQDVIDKVVKFMRSGERKNPFRNGIPGDKWFSLFRRRHNSHFLDLNPEMLRAVEKLGFTEKVMNTVTYPRRPLLIDSVKTAVVSKSKVADKTSSQMAALSSSPGSEDGTDDRDRSQESRSDSADFQPGSKLEVMDFDKKWYPVKVMKVDHEKGEVLVHFVNWSHRYDEWMRMDSNRIRRPKLQQSSNSKNVKVSTIWTYNYKYPASVWQVLPNGLSEKQERGRERWKEKVLSEEEIIEEEDEYEYEFEKVFICEDRKIHENLMMEC